MRATLWKVAATGDDETVINGLCRSTFRYKLSKVPASLLNPVLEGQ